MNVFNLLHLSAEVVHRVAQNCDILTLLALRTTCKSLYEEVTALLAMERKQLLQFYVPRPDNLWEHLEGACAVVGGLAALSFVLRSPELRPPVLDVFVASDQEEFLEQWIAQDGDLCLQDERIDVYDAQDRRRTRERVARTRTYLCHNGRSIHIHTSTSLSPLDPIVSSVTTALCNWVSSFVFACGYPALTMKRRAVGPDVFRRATTVGLLYARLRNSGFEIQSDPSAWTDYGALVPEPANDYRQSCLRSLYLCPSQGRFFGDPGTIVNVFDLRGCDRDALRSLHQPPYGIATVWRRGGGWQMCDGPCSYHDPLLPDGVFVHAAVIVSSTIRFATTYVGP